MKNISQELLQKISLYAFERNHSAVSVTDGNVDNPSFLYVNPMFTRQSGYSYDELIGRSPKTLQGEKTDRERVDRFKKTLKAKAMFQGQATNYKKDGSEYTVDWNVMPILDDEGTVTHYVSFQIDVTHRTALERRDCELLLHKSRLASVGELMNSLAHQWKQPVCVISTLSQILLHDMEREGNIEAMRAKIEKILEQVDFMHETITSFQNFLRPVDPRSSFNVKKAIKETMALIESELMAHRISIGFISEEDVLEVTGSENEFKQVVLNLLSNAKDAFVSQEVASPRKIEIKTTREGSFVDIELIDNAGGIKMSPIEKIFEENVSTKGDKGTGIGLCIVQRIVTRLQGEIGVSLVGDDGTKFYMRLPLNR